MSILTHLGFMRNARGGWIGMDELQSPRKEGMC